MRATPAALCVLLACGRSGYESRPGDGGVVDGDGGGSGFDGSLPDDCMTVTTAGDEADAGEIPVEPHLGDGLSLREALTLASAAEGEDCVRFDDAIESISIPADLPPLDDPDGLLLDGNGRVALHGGVGTSAVLRLASGNNTIRGLEITGITRGIVVEADSSVLRDLHLHSIGEVALELAAGAGAELGPCLIHDNGDSAIVARGSVGLSVVHCTIADNQVSGIDATLGASGLSVRNSIIAENGDPGIVVDDQATIDAIEFSDVAENQIANCMGCTLGDGCTESDPDFTDAALEDYTLQATSPAIDTGTDLGLDRNGAGAGDFNGDAPDMGYFESPAI